MKTVTRKLGIGLISFAMSGMAGLSAHADDTEIFFGGSTNESVNPNVLFILDTSGSMSDKDGGTTSRLDRMKSAFRSLMGGLNNVNVGLMRFNDPGGPIIYPVSNIDAEINATSGLSGSASSIISESSNDAEQSSSSAVTLNNQSLAVTTRTSAGGSNTVQIAVNASADDAEETLSNNSMEVNNSGSLETPFDGAIDGTTTSDPQAIGVIFRNAGIPKGATILEASLRFQIHDRRSSKGSATGQYSQSLDLAITGQTGTTVANFGTQNINSRPKTTSSVTWAITDPSPAAGSSVNSTNLSTVVQELVNQSSWSTTSDVALFLRRPTGGTKTGSRDFSSYDHGSSRAPILIVKYELAATADVQTVGLRFGNLKIPQGATITDASLSMTASGNNSGTTLFNIYGEDADNSAPFTTASGNLNRTNTAATATWMPGAWTTGTTYETSDDGVDLTAIVQEIVNRDDWCGGNALTLLITGSGTRYAHSYESSPSNAPALNVSYDPNTIPTDGGCMATDVSYQIDSSSDDVENTTSDSKQSTSGNVISLGYDGSNKQAVGLRFTGIQIPKDATISNAYLEFTAYDNQSSSVSYVIYGEDASNPSTYSNSRKANNLSTIATTVNWNSVESWTQNVSYRSPDISSIIGDLVGASGWVKGNSISLIVKIPGTSGTRNAHSFDSDAAKAPRLVITASSSSGAIGDTVRSKLVEYVDNMQAAGYTPIVDTLYEAANYYRGEQVVWGAMRGDASTMRSELSDRKYFRLSHPDSYTGGTVSLPSGCTNQETNDADCATAVIQSTPTRPTYLSPIVNECQTNHIVLLTDGEPTQNQSKSMIKSMIGLAGNCPSGYEGCGKELTKFLAEEDQSDDLSNDQNVTTHTIGLEIDNDFLADLAENGGGKYYAVSSASELEAAFKAIVGDMLHTDTTFVSPGVTVNSFNRLTHRSEIYYALFQPQETARWPGNLKRYKLSSTGDILDKNDAVAIDPTSGFFKKEAVSYWTTIEDGNNTTLGGAAANLPDYASRKVYTYYSGSASTTLSNAANQLNTSNTNITKARLAVETESDAYFQGIVNWARGQDIRDADDDDVTAENRRQLSDPLHSVPYLVTYGGTDEDPDITIYYGDNEGFLHAVDGATGEEHFTFIPESLLPNLKTLYENSGGDDHPYGLDGPVNAWVNDEDNDSTIESADGDHVYVYIGMRRGGRNYYALDVTDRNNPRYMWSITGGSGDFSALGQTWSRPVKTKVNISGTVREVLIFAGGYDNDQDDVTVITADDIGNAIYMIDAETGSLLWRAGNGAGYNLNLSEMQYSIPASIRAIDTNSDGLVDQMYVGDTGGQLWRFDVSNGSAASSLVTGAVIADVSGTTKADARRFYHEADVSLITEDGYRKLLVAIGSGFHAHPLSKDATDRFYAFKQASVFSAPADGIDSNTLPDYIKMTESDLYDATDNEIGEGDDAEKSAALAELEDADGWYITLENGGEKVLSTPLTYDGVTYFTTYEPSANTVGCVAAAGVSRLYAVNSANATPALNLDNSSDSDNLTEADRSTHLQTIGLAPDPVHLRIADDQGTADILAIGTETLKIGSGASIIKTYWYNH